MTRIRSGTAAKRWELTPDEQVRLSGAYDQALSHVVSTGSSAMWASTPRGSARRCPARPPGCPGRGERFRQELLRYTSAGMRVIDLGCGAGRFARDVAPIAGEVICVDASASLLREARVQLREHSNVHYVHNQGWTLPGIADRSVDLVFSQGLFGYIEPRAIVALAGEIHRVLKANGRFMFSVFTFRRGETGGRIREAFAHADARGRIHSGIPQPMTEELVLALLELAQFTEPGPGEVMIGEDGHSIFAATPRPAG
jgi:SAM-dependent methyltransferase